MENLKFLGTFTVEQVKRELGVDEIKVRKNPHSNKLFMTAGGKSIGTVSTNGIPKKPMISRVRGEVTELNPDGEFYLLHEEADGAEVIATF